MDKKPADFSALVRAALGFIGNQGLQDLASLPARPGNWKRKSNWKSKVMQKRFRESGRKK